MFVLPGPERKARIPDEEANAITAYHEGGHAIVAHFTKDSHPLHKVTIIPRGPSLGHVSNSLIKIAVSIYEPRKMLQGARFGESGERVDESFVFNQKFLCRQSGASRF
jgi:ATP-dependent Zn protease